MTLEQFILEVTIAVGFVFLTAGIIITVIPFWMIWKDESRMPRRLLSNLRENIDEM